MKVVIIDQQVAVIHEYFMTTKVVMNDYIFSIYDDILLLQEGG